ncbi:MAG: hypothetical protein RL199_529, partial [Pseudomonadota bacterium]
MTSAAGLSGRTALVTGAAVRLGRAIALELARAGADVVVHCHTSHREAEQVAAEVVSLGRRATVVQGDLSRPGDIERVFREADAFGTVDTLVLSAGVFERKAFED